MEAEIQARLSKDASIRIISPLSPCSSHYKCSDANGNNYFIKLLTEPNAYNLIKYEYTALNALQIAAHELFIKIPKTYLCAQLNSTQGAVLVMDFLDLRRLSAQNEAKLGTELAKMHMANWELLKKKERAGDDNKDGTQDPARGVSKFGFPSPTPCGSFLQPNDWKDTWLDFLVECRLQPQMDVVDDDEAQELWRSLKPNLSYFFEHISTPILPSLIHGDLWAGNVSESPSGDLLIYDPACSYSHHEFELAIMAMFGGFSSEFWTAYHQLLPKEDGFKDRHELYQLYHYLNHWNIFGSGYRSPTIRILKSLVKKLKSGKKL